MNENRRKDEVYERGIVFVADNWGTYKGGIDVFNQKLCEAMAYVIDKSKVVVICVVIGSVEGKIKQKYKERGINVIDYMPCSDEIESDNNLVQGVMMHIYEQKYCGQETRFVWIGHDIKMGTWAYLMSRINKGKCAVIFHTDFYLVHADRDDVSVRTTKRTDYNQKMESQKNLAKIVDWVFCVGPLVYDRLKEGVEAKSSMIIPGLEDKPDNSNKLNTILTAGRFYGSSSKQKNWKKVCDAIVKALDQLHGTIGNFATYQTIIYGFDENMQDTELDKLSEEINNYMKEKSEKGLNPIVHAKRFDKRRIEYLKELANCKVFIMGSEKESFGLVAWEALSLEVPIVVSDLSGIYCYLEAELGYLSRGLCGIFPANMRDTVEEMGKSIAGILKNDKKIEKSTQLLRSEMSKHKWEALAIDIARTMGIVDVMDSAIYRNHNCFEFTYANRELLFEELKRRVESKRIYKRIFFFGGISRRLIEQDDDFLIALLELLSNDKEKRLHIYFCYETDEAIEQRLSELDEIMDRKKDILYAKAKKVAYLKDTLKELYRKDRVDSKLDNEFEGCIDRVHLIPLKKSPSVYINILDNEWYFTLKYENRSSENATMKLSNGSEGMDEKLRLVEHMRFILKNDINSEECSNMLKELHEWAEEE